MTVLVFSWDERCGCYTILTTSSVLGQKVVEIQIGIRRQHETISEPQTTTSKDYNAKKVNNC